ncbi:hypothetical protein M011DRAFT_471390 [Sporormia fimetaria CBS 119925]|uniref:Extracellular mutant protein 11 C-terminal domain-containing protein n=1 Tax=Sporormia fimetaria CBS 119925 TaxID=1340428 RepID=A0A6A6V2L6_9PLEO|nr:hypothetical protein M011DRAFT_471390 [Sporormia fimetaria CBS 119925]
MNEFVKAQGGANSRAQIAAKLRVKNTDLPGKNGHSQQQPQMGRINTQHNGLPARGSGQRGFHKPTFDDTDTGSIDTTIADDSRNVNNHNDHHNQNNHLGNHDNSNEDHEEYGDDDFEGVDDGEYEQQEDNSAQLSLDSYPLDKVPPELEGVVSGLVSGLLSQQQGQSERGSHFQQGMQFENTSYPDTTDGGFDEKDQELYDEHEEEGDEQGYDSPSLNRKQAHPTTQSHILTHQPVPQRANQPSIFQQGNQIREATRTPRNKTAPVSQPVQRQSSRPKSTTPGPYHPAPQERREIASLHDPRQANAGNSIHKPNKRGSGTRTPFEGTGASLSRPTTPAPTQPVSAPASKQQPASRRNSNKQTAQTLNMAPPATPIEDYDLTTLYQMSYEELKNEDFDHVPRKQPPVLSQDMLGKPLPDRLDHVMKGLAPDDQSKFFMSLPTAEWEEAGDWFLEKFQDIIGRTTQARQQKRKLARGFEGEVEKRHQHVAKKRRQVDQALQDMRSQGQNVLPRSPRPSKSPARH